MAFREGSARSQLRAPLTLLAIALAAWALLLLLGDLREVLFLGFFGIVLASALEYPIGLLSRVMPRWSAVLITLLAFVAVLVLVGLLFVPVVTSQATAIIAAAPAALSSVQGWWRHLTNAGALEGLVGNTSVGGELGGEISSLLHAAVPATISIAVFLAKTVAVVFLAFFFAASPRSYERGFVRLFPKTAEPRLRDVLGSMGHAIQGWVLGTLVSMSIIGVLTAVATLILGLDAWLALGVAAFFGEFVPYFGPISAFAPAFFMALAISPSRALWTVIVYLGIQELEGHLIQPLVMRRAIKIRPAILVLSQLLFGGAFGFLGLLVVAPMLAAVKAALEKGYIQAVLGREPDGD